MAEDASVAVLSGGSITHVASQPEALARVVTAWKQYESQLVEHTVTLDVWRVPEPAYRAVLDAGKLAIGRVVPSDVLQVLRSAEGASFESIRMPVLDGAGAGFRIGASVPGLIDFEVEVAQQAAAMDPLTWALFRGVFADVTITGGFGESRVHAAGEVVWADPAAGTAEMAFRPPVSMKPAHDGQKPEPDHRRRVKLPLLSGGSATFDRRLGVANGGETLLHVSVRGEEVTLVLVGSTPRR